jgi:hypothetical protein
VNPAGGGDVDLVGGVVLVLAALGWAVGTLLSRGQRLTVSPLIGAGMQMLCGGAVLGLAGLVAGELRHVDPGGASVRSLGALAYLIVFGSLLAFSAYVWLLRNAATSLVATYAYVNPVVAVGLGRPCSARRSRRDARRRRDRPRRRRADRQRAAVRAAPEQFRRTGGSRGRPRGHAGAAVAMESCVRARAPLDTAAPACIAST